MVSFVKKISFKKSETEQILFENGYFRIPKFGTQINYFKNKTLISLKVSKICKCANFGLPGGTKLPV